MKSFEPVYTELEELFIQKLPDFIEKINKEYNDGIIIKTFENTSLEENCIKTHSFIVNIEEIEYSEKDRIIENTVFKVSFELKLLSEMKQKTNFFSRYVEAIQSMLNESETKYLYKIIRIKKLQLIIQIVL